MPFPARPLHDAVRFADVWRPTAPGTFATGLRHVRTLALLLSAISAPALSQAASLSGKVLLDVKETPLANAEVQLPKLKLSVRSDSSGAFLVTGIPKGTHQVLVRLIGFEPFAADVKFDGAERVEAELILKPAVTKLETVDVKDTKTTGPWAIKLAEFDERRAGGIGRFLTADFFESMDGRPPSSFLAQKIPGMRIVNVNGRSWIASTRGCGGGTCPAPPRGQTLEKIPQACYMQVVVNGIVRFNDNMPMFDLDELNTKDIIGFEFYTLATTPLQYNKTSSNTVCGTVVIWTKGG